MVEPIMVVVVAVSILLSNDDCGNKESINEERDDGIDSGSHGRNGDGVGGRTVAAFDCGLRCIKSASAVPMSAHQTCINRAHECTSNVHQPCP
jgi:hypothetical protein